MITTMQKRSTVLVISEKPSQRLTLQFCFFMNGELLPLTQAQSVRAVCLWVSLLAACLALTLMQLASASASIAGSLCCREEILCCVEVKGTERNNTDSLYTCLSSLLHSEVGRVSIGNFWIISAGSFMHKYS